MISLPEEIDSNDFLITNDSSVHNDISDELSDDSDEENEVSVGSKRKNTNNSFIKQSKKSKILLDLTIYRKLYSKIWILFLSLTFTVSQHKIILKHISKYVINDLVNPLLLADYLTNCYNFGYSNNNQSIVISIFALESLFHLIITYNLDYPNFFLSLYNLCNKEIFEIKYRNNFMDLLSKSLQSNNLSIYIVSAFIKRLSYITLHIPSPSIYYCINQIICLLKKHIQCQLLIHNNSENNQSNQNELQTEYNSFEKHNLENTNAIHSSLWEMELLQNHYLYSINELSKKLENPNSTAIESEDIYLPETFDYKYSDLIENELKNYKNNSVLGFYQPNKLFSEESIVTKAFGIK